MGRVKSVEPDFLMAVTKNAGMAKPTDSLYFACDRLKSGGVGLKIWIAVPD
jgi:hypothetical protein